MALGPNTTSKPLPEIPPPRVAVVDPETGKFTKEWYEYFAKQRETLVKMREELDEAIRWINDYPP